MEPTGLRRPTATVFLSRDQLWFLRSRVRHESADQDKWKAPPSDVDLNRQIADAILRCEEVDLPGAWLELSKQDCLLIDYVTDQDAKGSDGRPIGRPLLLATFAAYRELEEGPMPTAEDPDEEAKISELRTLQEQGN
jgi:hypothetical protein